MREYGEQNSDKNYQKTYGRQLCELVIFLYFCFPVFCSLGSSVVLGDYWRGSTPKDEISRYWWKLLWGKNVPRTFDFPESSKKVIIFLLFDVSFEG